MRAAFALPACEIVLAPSGTDAQLLAPLWACGPASAPLAVVAVAPEELGRGSASALGGRAPFQRTPAGSTVRAGAPIPGFGAPAARLLPVPARDRHGRARPAAAVDSDVCAAVERALARGERVLVHAVAASKTGLAGPSAAALDDALSRGGERVRAIVDAAQGRLPAQAPAGWLARGFLVVVSGSKFFGGPAFSGALLVPPGPPPPAPAGLGDYLAAPGIPVSWDGWRQAARRDGGPGLLLRWQAALPGLEAFACLPARERTGRAARLASSLRAAAEGCPVCDGVEEHAGIVSFGVVAGGRRLAAADLAHLKDALAQPAPGAAPPILIGEPTRRGPGDRAALRVAVGAPQILRAATPEAWAALSEEIGRIFAALAAAVQALEAPEPLARARA